MRRFHRGAPGPHNRRERARRPSRPRTGARQSLRLGHGGLRLRVLRSGHCAAGGYSAPRRTPARDIACDRHWPGRRGADHAVAGPRGEPELNFLVALTEHLPCARRHLARRGVGAEHRVVIGQRGSPYRQGRDLRTGDVCARYPHHGSAAYPGAGLSALAHWTRAGALRVGVAPVYLRGGAQVAGIPFVWHIYAERGLTALVTRVVSFIALGAWGLILGKELYSQ